MTDSVPQNQGKASKVRLAIVQYELRKIESFADFAKQCTFFVTTAAGYKADFVLFPELFTTQLLSFASGDAVKFLTEITPRYIELFAGLSRESGMYIVAGSNLCEESGKVYNISYFFDRKGNAAKQYKLHVTPHEKNMWNVEGGRRVEIFETDQGKIAILICYDVEFPELSRIAADGGAQIIFVPSNTDQRFGYLRVRYCAQARCIENQVYVAVSGCTGNTPVPGGGEIHYAQSAIFTPSDMPFPQEAIVAQCAENVETMIIQDVDLSLLDENRLNGAVRPLMDRRHDLYQLRHEN